MLRASRAAVILLAGLLVRVGPLVLVGLLGLAGAGPAHGELAPEPVGRSLSLPAQPGPHWVWIGDMLLRRASLWDADSGTFLGQLNGGFGVVSPLTSLTRRQIYMPETHYTRHHRGERKDWVTIYDLPTLSVVGEVSIPPKRAEYASGVATSALLDGERFVVVFNLTPASSVSVVDVETQRFVGEISTPGCALVYPIGERSFAMLCGDGTLLAVHLDEDGREARRQRSEPFFDAENDPVTEKAARLGSQWVFVSFSGRAHPVEFGPDGPRPGETWSLIEEKDNARSWKIGGQQHLAAHAPTGRLYSLVHQGGEHTHKAPGTEIWVYDTASQQRVQTIPVRNLTAAFVSQVAELEGGLVERLVHWIVPSSGASAIFVTQDPEPILLVASREAGTVAVLDALTGEFLRDLRRSGIATGLLMGP